ncbi:MAG: EutN/CcmL family microcompartment protein [Chloroflexi bacterium]|nr:EutN/CcmL family microcompartment protein [Chloroflexota bacterium]
MILGKVVGTVVSTIKHPAFAGRKLLLVRPLHLSGENPEDDFLAVDAAQAGIGDTVLVCQEGNSTRQVIGIPNAPVRSSIVGVIDSISLQP